MTEQEPSRDQRATTNKKELRTGLYWLAGTTALLGVLFYAPTYQDWRADNKAIQEKSGPASTYVKQKTDALYFSGARVVLREVGKHHCDRDLHLLSFPPDSNDEPRHCSTTGRIVIDFTTQESVDGYSQVREAVADAVTDAGLDANHYMGAGNASDAQRVHFKGQDFNVGTDWELYPKGRYNQSNNLFKIDGVPSTTGSGYLVELVVKGFSVDYGQTNYVNNHGH